MAKKSHRARQAASPPGNGTVSPPIIGGVSQPGIGALSQPGINAEPAAGALNTSDVLDFRSLGRAANEVRASSPAVSADAMGESTTGGSPARRAMGGFGLAALFGWAYWPVLSRLAHAWETEPDYSHGWLVAPVAAYILWSRRCTAFDTLDRPRATFAWGGLVLLTLSLVMRVLGSLWYIDAVEAWSLPLWVAGAVWLVGGRRLCWWAAPGIAFLVFMIPWPYSAERLLSRPLQQMASRLSCWILQTIGQPALQEGNVVLIDDVRLNVVEACSGLRIFVSIIALAYVYVVLNQKPWWLRLALFMAVVPVAVLVNALRIATTGVLHVLFSGEAARHFSHDFAGWVMLPVAGALLAAWLWYLSRLFVEIEVVNSGRLLPVSRSS
jgi:exosortase